MEDEVLTLPQISSLLSDDEARVERAQRPLTAARNTFAGLTDRTRFSTDQGHAGAVAEHGPALERAEADAAAIASATERNARMALSHLQGAARPTLGDDELRAASGRAVFVKEDCETLGWPELRDAVRRAVVAGDKVEQFLFLRYAKPRVMDRETPDEGRPGEEAARREVGAMLDRIAGDLRDGRFDPTIERARAVLARSQDLHRTASERRARREAEQAVERVIGSAGVRVPSAAAD